MTIPKLVANTQGDANNSTGIDIKNAVNALIANQEVGQRTSTLAEAIADTTLVAGMFRTISDRGNATFKVITKGSVDHVDKPNTFSVVECTGVSTLALALDYDKTFYVRHFGAVGDRVVDDTAAMVYILSRLTDHSTLRFDGATCSISSSLRLDSVNGLAILGDGGGLYKSGGTTLFTNPMLQLKFCNDLRINNILIEGSFNGSSIAFGDYGVRVLSSERVLLSDSLFKNLGDSAWTVSTADGSLPLGETKSKDVTVTGNMFDNVWQTSTTGNSGGVIGYVFSNNICNTLGAVKFASRSDNAKNLVVSGNTITSATDAAIELVGYTDVLIKGNTINGKAYGINTYLNPYSEAATSPLKDIRIESNIIKSETGPCLRVNTELLALSPYNYTGLSIKNNTISRSDELGNAEAFYFKGDGFDDVTIEGNNIKGGFLYMYERGNNNLVDLSKGVRLKGNTVVHPSTNNAPFISGAGTEIPRLSITGNDVVSAGGLVSLNKHAAVLNNDLVIRGNIVRSEGSVIDTGYGNSHIIKDNRLISTTTTTEVITSSATSVYLSGNIIETARTGRAARLDYASMTYDGGGNVLPSTATASFYGGITDVSGPLTHTG